MTLEFFTWEGMVGVRHMDPLSPKIDWYGGMIFAAAAAAVPVFPKFIEFARNHNIFMVMVAPLWSLFNVSSQEAQKIDKDDITAVSRLSRWHDNCGVVKPANAAYSKFLHSELQEINKLIQDYSIAVII